MHPPDLYVHGSACIFTMQPPAVSRSNLPPSFPSPGEVWSRRKRGTESFPCCPPSVGFPCGHGWDTLLVALSEKFAPSRTRLHARHSEGCVRTYKMIVSAPPCQVSQLVWSGLRRSPGATCQRSSPLTDGQVHPFNTGRIQPSREAQAEAQHP
jgi:hypothetical protein